jgi:3'-phosphoadenosine 5'-phosphosulfate sulfotransferase (PAPS reductase)/FAD synthetase
LEHIVSFSGGKDSTAMLLMMLEKNMPIDEIIFCDTGKEFPQMYDHIEKVQKYIGGGITVLCAEKTFDYYMFDHEKTKGKHKGKHGYGWPNMLCRWCTAMLKQAPLKKHMESREYTSYIGIAYDEPKRHQNIPANVIHPLYDWQVTEKMASQYCYEHGFDWGGLYEHFDRVSCWCCPLKNNKELMQLYVHYPELWRELKDMDNRAYNKFKGKGVDFYEKKIIQKLRNKQMSLFEE